MKPQTRQRADSQAPEMIHDDDALRLALGLKDADRPEQLPIATIRRDGGTQPRATLNESVIDEYAAEMKAGVRFPPVEVVYDGSDYWMWDGFHRVAAAERAGLPTIEAHITQGTRRDAVLLSVGVNAEHGLRRTNEDKRRAVMTLLNDPEWGQWSDHEIAVKCHVSHTFVGNVRRSLETVSSEERTYTTKHGTTATMKTSKIREANQQRAQPAATQPVTRRDRSPRAQQRAQPAGTFDGLDPDRLANLLRVLNGAPSIIAMFIKHQTDEDVALMRRLELDKPAPRPEVLLVLDRRLGQGSTPESIPDHEPAYKPGPDDSDERAVAERLLDDVAIALQDLRGIARQVRAIRALDDLAVLDDTALGGVLDMLRESLDDLTGRENQGGEFEPGLVDHLAALQEQVMEMLHDGDSEE